MKRFIAALIVSSLITATPPAQAVPTFNEMSNELFGSDGVIMKAHNWALEYILGASGVILFSGLIGYWLKALKN